MKVIIAGSRNIDEFSLVEKAVIESGFNITEVVSGGAHGVDRLGELYAKRNNIPCKYFYPDWAIFGKAAGAIRNKQMVLYADALIAIWDGKSKGTAITIAEAKKINIKFFIFNTNG